MLALCADNNFISILHTAPAPKTVPYRVFSVEASGARKKPEVLKKWQ
jgi:hypothetical protein